MKSFSVRGFHTPTSARCTYILCLSRNSCKDHPAALKTGSAGQHDITEKKTQNKPGSGKNTEAETLRNVKDIRATRKKNAVILMKFLLKLS